MLLITTLLLGIITSTAPMIADEDTYTLDNGLKVTLIDTPGGERSAIVVLFDIGGDHDPPGKSGLIHLLEHLHVTAATEHQEARSVEKYMHQYPLGWNAQTGAQCTIFATVFPKDQIGTELRDGETLADARSRVDGIVHDALHHPVNPEDAAWLEFSYGPMLGLMDIPPMMANKNPYLAAFATGRQAQMGLNGGVLRERLRAVGDPELAALREWLDTDQGVVRLNVITGPDLPEQNRPSGP